MTRLNKPKDYNTVSPYLIVEDADQTIEFLETVFEAEELRRFPNAAGKLLHAEVRIDDTVVMLADAGNGWEATPSYVHIYVRDVDAAYRKALAAGAVSVEEPTRADDMEKRGGIRDPGGTTWWMTTQTPADGHVNSRDSTPIVRELRVAVTSGDYEALAAFYREGLGLEPAQTWPEEQGRALVLDLGRATLEIFDERQARTIDEVEVGHRISGRVRFALQVPGLEAATERLVACGARLVHGPIDTPWGDRVTRFEDPDAMQVTLFQPAPADDDSSLAT